MRKVKSPQIFPACHEGPKVALAPPPPCGTYIPTGRGQYMPTLYSESSHNASDIRKQHRKVSSSDKVFHGDPRVRVTVYRSSIAVKPTAD